jgi:hypothetical protein
MSTEESELISKRLPPPVPFPLLAKTLMSNVDLSPMQQRQIALLNLNFIKRVNLLENDFIKNLSKIIDNLGH